MATIGCYRIISPTNKNYFGKSINIERRLKGYAKARCKSQPKLYRSILKHGWGNHIVVIYECSEDQMDDCEKYHIAWLSCIKHGLNCMQGGNGARRCTDEQKKRMGESKKGLFAGEKNPMWGKKWSQERKDARKKWLNENVEKIRESSRKSSTGRVYSQESRDKKSKSLMGHTVSDAVRQRLRECRSKIVYQYNLSGEFIKEYSSVLEATRQTMSFKISECANGKLKTSGGFIWKYTKD